MIIEAGRHEHRSANGTTINVDRHLSPAEVELVAAILERANVTPHQVSALEIVAEGMVLLHCPFVVNGRLECEHRHVAA